MQNEKKVFEIICENSILKVEINHLAKQANGSVLVSYKDNVILSVSVLGDQYVLRNFFPLTVHYQEKLYAVGKIPGGFLRRESKSSDQEVLCSRLIDRSLRPFFSEELRNEVQLINMVLSSEIDNNNAVIALLGSSLSLLISDIPYFDPVSAVCIGKIKDQLIVNPTVLQREKSEFYLFLSGNEDYVNMIEMTAKEVSEESLLEAIIFGHKIIKKLCIFQKEIFLKLKPSKKTLLFTKNNDLLVVQITDKYSLLISQLLKKPSYQQDIKDLKKDLLVKYKEKFLLQIQMDNGIFDNENQQRYLLEVEQIFNFLLKQEIRKIILEQKIRLDNRLFPDIRKITSSIDILPRAHGSALFTRGNTQSLSIVTLGTLKESKIIDDLSDENNKRFMLHYNFPAFAVGSIGKYFSPNRREIGHGMLAEKALEYVLPSENIFPYCVRVVSEILESDGSSSQATICAASMSLMAAGVPLKSLVAGVAMGLVFDENTENYAILSDISGLEDHYGDMDFKIAGTEKGITALQMDMKIKGIDWKILKKTLEQAKINRIYILHLMKKTIFKSRQQVSCYAPKVKMISIKPEEIRNIIGSGGKVINQIIEIHDNVKIDIMPDGKIYIMHHNLDIITKVADYIQNCLKKVEVGLLYKVKILRFMNDKMGKSFGAIAEIWPGIEGFIHISKLANYKVNKVEDILQIGQIILVKCIKINERGQIDLSKKDL